jgi:hypothetical protein
MKATIEPTLWALAHIDSGTLALTVDERIYPEPVVRSFAAACLPYCHAIVERLDNSLRLQLIATDPRAARLQIGNALTELLKGALSESNDEGPIL